MKSFLVALTILSLSRIVFSQDIETETNPKEAKNGIVVSAGSILLVSTATIAYERKIISFGRSDQSSLWGKGRYAKFSGYLGDEQDKSFDLSVFTLLGSGRSFTELSLGLALTSGDYIVFPALSVGYRFQKREGGIIFRTGAGFPELFYLGLGYSF